MRKIPCILATSVCLIFPSEAFIFNWLQIVASSLPSFFSLTFNTLQYFLGFSLSVRIPRISIIEKYHSSLSSSQLERIRFPSKILISLSILKPLIYYELLNLQKTPTTYANYCHYICFLN